MAGIKIFDLPALGRDLASTDLLELSLAGGTGSRKITGQEIMNASKLNVGNTPIINGAVGQVLFQGTGNVLQESSNLFWDNANIRLGIGTSSPANTLDVIGNSLIRVSSGTTTVTVGGSSPASGATPDGVLILAGSLSRNLTISSFRSQDPLINSTNNLRIAIGGTQYFNLFSTGNLLLQNGGTFTDAGYRLDVNGNIRGSNNLVINNIIANSGQQLSLEPGASGSRIRLKVGHGLTDGIVVDSDSNSVPLTGDYSVLRLALNFAPTSGNSIKNYITVNPTINQTGGANGITRGLYIQPTLTAAADFRAIETTVGNVLFGSNFFWDNTNGRLGIGTSTPARALDIVGGSAQDVISFRSASGVAAYLGTENASSGRSWFSSGLNGTLASVQVNTFGVISLLGSFRVDIGNGSTNYLRVFGSTGNVLIQNGGTLTDAGFRLDVNGTARFTGNVSLGSPNINDKLEVYGNILVRANDRIRLAGTTDGNTAIWASSATSVQTNIKESGIGATYDVTFGTIASNTRMLRVYASGLTSTTTIIGVNATLQTSAVLQADSTTQGFLPPRMTQTQRNAIASPAIGLEIYQTDATEGKYIYKSSGWTYIG